MLYSLHYLEVHVPTQPKLYLTMTLIRDNIEFILMDRNRSKGRNIGHKEGIEMVTVSQEIW